MFGKNSKKYVEKNVRFWYSLKKVKNGEKEMNKKIILTSILAISFAMPAFARAGDDDAGVQPGVGGSEQCDTATLGQSENNSTANVEATWVPNTYNVRYRYDDDENSQGWNGFYCGETAQSNNSLQNPDTTNCSKPTYGESFTFAHRYKKKGYTFANWSCVKYNKGQGPDMAIDPSADSGNETSNSETFTFSSGQTITWNIDGDLYCTAQWTANRINIDWFSDGTRVAQNYCEYNSTITLPETPIKTGYTFNGWTLHDDCAELNSQSTCNANASCYWRSESNKCIKTGVAVNNCRSASDSATCANYEYCSWQEIDMQSISHCIFADVLSVCHNRTTQSECEIVTECVWNADAQTCGSLFE